MKLVALAAAMIVGGGMALMAPTSAEAMPRAAAPVDVTQTTDVQNVHGTHRRWRRGHRHRRYKRRHRSRHYHRHCHRHRCHRHRHYSGHHGSRSYGRRGGVYIRLF